MTPSPPAPHPPRQRTERRMPKPLAIGLIRVRADGRFVRDEGYALLEIFEVVGEPVRDSSSLTVLRHLAHRAGASALLVTDDVPHSLFLPALSDAEMTVIVVRSTLCVPRQRA